METILFLVLLINWSPRKWKHQSAKWSFAERRLPREQISPHSLSLSLSPADITFVRLINIDQRGDLRFFFFFWLSVNSDDFTSTRCPFFSKVFVPSNSVGIVGDIQGRNYWIIEHIPGWACAFQRDEDPRKKYRLFFVDTAMHFTPGEIMPRKNSCL